LTKIKELKRRIELKRQLIILIEQEITELEERLAWEEETQEVARG
jgi:hypothetical protein